MDPAELSKRICRLYREKRGYERDKYRLFAEILLLPKENIEFRKTNIPSTKTVIPASNQIFSKH